MASKKPSSISKDMARVCVVMLERFVNENPGYELGFYKDPFGRYSRVILANPSEEYTCDDMDILIKEFRARKLGF